VVEPVPELDVLPRAVLVTIDGVRWEDVFAGYDDDQAPLMPNLHRRVREAGALVGGPGCANDMRASGPNPVSLPGYIEIFSGRIEPSCTYNDCPFTPVDTFLDDVRAAPGTAATDVAVFSSWSPYGRTVAKGSRVIVSAGGDARAVNKVADDGALRAYLAAGAAAPAFPGYADYRPDAHTGRAAARWLELARPRMLVVGLGDPDEYAHRGDVAGYKSALRAADDLIGELVATAARLGPEGKKTTFLVTTDHGRAKMFTQHGWLWPESQRVFFAAFGAGVQPRGVACAKAPLKLAHIAPMMRALLGVPRAGEDGGPLAQEILAEPAGAD
jgi:hypothetical protein